MLFSDFLPVVQIIAFGVNILLVLFIVPLRKSLDELRLSDDRLSDRLQALEVKIAERYVPRTEIQDAITDMRRKLERIEHAVMAGQTDKRL